MKVLIIHAHPEPASMCSALKDVAVETYTAAGHEVRVSDLYAGGFAAVASRGDFDVRANPDFFKYQTEQLRAFENGDAYAQDILEEQEKLLWADLVILNFPIWWFSVPAILKGWIDRVLTFGRLYAPGKMFAGGGMRGKQAMLTVTTGGLAAMFEEGGFIGTLPEMLRHVTLGTLHCVGFDVLESFFAYAPARATPEARAADLDAYRAALGAPREILHGFPAVSGS